MTSTSNGYGQDRLDQILAEAKRHRLEREKGYRERALKLFPWICARCGREFSGKRLRELTVHHKDHDHDNNPPDGSNWELLCLYCHDNEHARFLSYSPDDPEGPDGETRPIAPDRPFAGLDQLLKGKR